MPNFICTTCGTQYADSEQPPAVCPTCQDERQYVKKTSQQWTTLDKLRLTYRNSIKFKERGLILIDMEPHFAIGQRALFLRMPDDRRRILVCGMLPGNVHVEWLNPAAPGVDSKWEMRLYGLVRTGAKEKAIRFLQETRGMSHKEATIKVAGIAAELRVK